MRLADSYGELRPTVPLLILGVALVLVVLAVVLIVRSQRPRPPRSRTSARPGRGPREGD
ncbi:MAG: hypothetical protein NVS3B10_08510 [Polyangiales bacterium]